MELRFFWVSLMVLFLFWFVGGIWFEGVGLSLFSFCVLMIFRGPLNMFDFIRPQLPNKAPPKSAILSSRPMSLPCLLPPQPSHLAHRYDQQRCGDKGRPLPARGKTPGGDVSIYMSVMCLCCFFLSWEVVETKEFRQTTFGCFSWVTLRNQPLLPGHFRPAPSPEPHW